MDWLPGADLSQRYDATFPGTRMQRAAKGVLHTTETASWPGYGGGKTAPHFTVLWTGTYLRYRQHFPLWMSSRALKNLPGGVGTNTDDAVQVELIGTCDAAYARRWPDTVFWPRAPRGAMEGLRGLMRLIELNTAIPRQSSVRWKSYAEGAARGSYGAVNGVRLSGVAWESYRGWLGHQHVAENTHGDPGDIDIAYLLNIPVKVDDDLTPEEHNWLRDLHTIMSARKFGRSDTQIGKDEERITHTLIDDDVPDIALAVQAQIDKTKDT